MFCKNCGNQCAETDNVCAQCGTHLKDAPEVHSAPKAASFDLAPYIRYIALGIAALALIFGIMNLFSLYDVNASYMGLTIPVPPSENTAMLIGNILYGLILLAVAGVAAMYGLKELNGMPYYDKYIAKLPLAKQPLTLIGGAAAAGGILQFIMYMLADVSPVSVSVHWTTWIMVLLGAGLVAVDKFVLNKK